MYLGPSFVEINLDAIGHNVREVRKLIGEHRRFMAVVKGDAYGHGAVLVARVALDNGATDLGVTNLMEAIELRNAGITAPIMVLGSILPEEAELAAEAGVTVAVWQLEVVQALNWAARRSRDKVKVHIEVNTGLNRFGLRPTAVPEFLETVRELDSIEVEGIFTHFSAATAGNLKLTRRQLTIFMDLVAELASEGIAIPIKHAANSEAAILLPESRLDMVRIGNLLYGRAGVETKLPLLDPWKLKSKVVSITEVKAGEGVSYGPIFRARRDMRIAVLPVGYSDGVGMEPVSRTLRFVYMVKVMVACLANWLGMPAGRFSPTRGLIWSEYGELPVVGRITMQQTLVDVTYLPEVEAGTPVTIEARRIAVSARLPKVFVAEGRVVSRQGTRELSENGTVQVSE
ncbi:MAG: alanine racemase [Bacillota bacterium]